MKEKKRRFSAVRNFILDSLGKNNNPLSVFDLQKLFKKNKLPANKTTIYREINFLRKEKTILEVRLHDRKKYYEMASKDHHHHIICVKCGKIKDFVGCGSKNIISKALKQAPDFAEIKNHTFDFFGLCKSCVK